MVLVGLLAEDAVPGVLIVSLKGGIHGSLPAWSSALRSLSSSRWPFMSSSAVLAVASSVWSAALTARTRSTFCFGVELTFLPRNGQN